MIAWPKKVGPRTERAASTLFCAVSPLGCWVPTLGAEPILSPSSPGKPVGGGCDQGRSASEQSGLPRRDDNKQTGRYRFRFCFCSDGWWGGGKWNAAKLDIRAGQCNKARCFRFFTEDMLQNSAARVVDCSSQYVR